MPDAFSGADAERRGADEFLSRGLSQRDARWAASKNARRLKNLAKASGAILDFGCGDGSFLTHATEEMPGRELWGFEIGERCETLRAANGRVTVVKGELKDLLERLPGCAVITMNHVIEHLPDPQAAVSALAARLLSCVIRVQGYRCITKNSTHDSGETVRC